MNLSAINFLTLSGEQIYLEKLDKQDLDEYWEAIRNSSIETDIFTGTQQKFNKTDIERYLDAIAEDRDRIDFLIRQKGSDKLAGEVVLNDIERLGRSGSLRVAVFDKEDFGKGYGSEAILLAIGYGFGMLNLHRIELEVFEYNKRAQHVYEKIGFIREGVRRDGCFYHNRYYDMVTMSILEEDFKNKYGDSLDLENLIQ